MKSSVVDDTFVENILWVQSFRTTDFLDIKRFLANSAIEYAALFIVSP